MPGAAQAFACDKTLPLIRCLSPAECPKLTALQILTHSAALLLGPFFCDPFPGGSGGGFSGGGSREPRPRVFPWPLLPPAFFGASGDQAVPKKPQDCRQACEQCLDAANAVMSRASLNL